MIGTVAVFATSIDKIMVWHFFGAEALALYIVALLIAWEGGRMIESLSVVLLPFLSEAEDNQNIRALLRNIPLLAIILTIVAIITCIAIPYLFHWVFPNYGEVTGLAQLSCALLVLLPLNSALYRYLMAMTLKTKMLLIQSLKIIVFIACFLLLYSQLDLAAPLLALIASEFLALIVLLGITITNARHA